MSADQDAAPVATAPPLPPPMPAPVLGYATPQSYQRSLDVWRENDLLVVRGRYTSLPDRCVHCNGEAEGYRLRRTLYWHHPAWYIMILWPGILIYAIVAMCIRRSVRVEMGLCRLHKKRRYFAIAMGWLLALGGIVLMIASGFLADQKFQWWPAVLILGIAAFIGGIVWGIVGTRTLWAKEITKAGVAYLRGAAPDYLNLFGGIVR